MYQPITVTWNQITSSWTLLPRSVSLPRGGKLRKSYLISYGPREMAFRLTKSFHVILFTGRHYRIENGPFEHLPNFSLSTWDRRQLGNDRGV